MVIHNRFRNAAVLDWWNWEGRRCLLIQGADEPVLAVYEDRDPDAVLELVPPAALVARLVELLRS